MIVARSREVHPRHCRRVVINCDAKSVVGQAQRDMDRGRPCIHGIGDEFADNQLRVRDGVIGARNTAHRLSQLCGAVAARDTRSASIAGKTLAHCPQHRRWLLNHRPDP